MLHALKRYSPAFVRRIASKAARAWRRLPAAKPPQRAPLALPPRPHKAPSRTLAIAAIIKNEAPYLAEWLEFHRMLGVQHVYLYDNGSTDNPGAVLAPFLRDGFASVVPWPSFDAARNAQHHAFAHAICAFGAEWQWMAFIDADEFLFPKRGDDLAEALRNHQRHSAISVRWTLFGTCGHKTPPSGGVLTNYTRRAIETRGKMLHGKIFRQHKSIVRPACVTHVKNAHTFLTADALPAFDISSELQLNHYYTRSLQDWQSKLARKAWGEHERRERLAAVEAATVHDDAILRFVPELRRRLGAKSRPAGDARVIGMAAHGQRAPVHGP
jgi:hypothetical protein